MTIKLTSDNEGGDVVLTTVANTIATFCDHYGKQYIC
jgi:hypothetical protein